MKTHYFNHQQPATRPVTKFSMRLLAILLAIYLFAVIGFACICVAAYLYHILIIPV